MNILTLVSILDNNLPRVVKHLKSMVNPGDVISWNTDTLSDTVDCDIDNDSFENVSQICIVKKNDGNHYLYVNYGMDLKKLFHDKFLISSISSVTFS